MLIANFNLTTSQMQILLAFRGAKDTRDCRIGDHPVSRVNPDVRNLRRLCADEYLRWLPGDRAKGEPPGYQLTEKGEMMLRIIEVELRRNLAMFEGGEMPQSGQSGGMSDVALGRGEVSRKGTVRRRKQPA